MSQITVYKDDPANAIFFENPNGAQFLNSLLAIEVSGTKVSVQDLAKGIEIVTNEDYDNFVDENGQTYGTNAAEVCNTLNVLFQNAGTSTDNPPVITSPINLSMVVGSTLNYTLEADFGVAYEWENLPSGITTVDGKTRQIIGGSNLVAGTYIFTATAINYNGADTQTITLTVSTPPFSNTKSIILNNNQYLTGNNVVVLNSTFGRLTNGVGAADAWTVSFYFKRGNSNNNSQTIFFFGQQDTNNRGYIQLKYNGNPNIGRRLTFTYGTNNNKLVLTTPLNSIGNDWQHILLSYDGGTTGSSSGSINQYYSRFSIFIDGVLQNTANSNSNFGFSSSIVWQYFRIGRFNTSQHLRNCLIEEFYIWDNDQSSNIAAIYNGGVPFDPLTLTDKPKHGYRMGDDPQDTFPTIKDVGTSGLCDLTQINMTPASIVNDVP
jgi:hypothetical protein